MREDKHERNKTLKLALEFCSQLLGVRKFLTVWEVTCSCGGQREKSSIGHLLASSQAPGGAWGLLRIFASPHVPYLDWNTVSNQQLGFILLFIIYGCSYAFEIITFPLPNFFFLVYHGFHYVLSHSVLFVIPWFPHLQEWGHYTCLFLLSDRWED